MNQEQLAEWHEVAEKTQGLIIPRLWAHNILERDPNIPYSEESTEIGAFSGMLLAELLSLWGTAYDDERLIKKLVIDPIVYKEIEINQNVSSIKFGCRSPKEIHNTLDRLEEWDLVTSRYVNDVRFVTPTTKIKDWDYWQFIRDEAHKKLDVFEETNIESQP